MSIIIFLSACVVLAVMYLGTRAEPEHEGESPAVAYWKARAERIEARRQQAVQAVDETTGAAVEVTDAEAEKERKRQEALARRAARAAKSGE